MPNCSPDTSYLSSPQFMVTALHSLLWVEVPVLSFGAYCILRKTPSQMRSVKWLMFNVHCWSSLADILLSFFGIPYVIYPAMAGWGLGVVDAPDVVFYSGVTLMGALFASVIAIYENRYYVLFGKGTCWGRVRKPFLLSIYLFVPFFFIPPYFYVPDQNYARGEVLRSLPCLPPFTYKHYPMYVLSLDQIAPFVCIAAATLIMGNIWITFCVLIFWNLLNKNNGIISSQTRRMQRKFAIALTLQSVFFLFVIFFPIITGFVIIILWYHNQTINNFIFILLSTHGFGSTVVMILVHKPYRDYALSLLLCRKMEKQSSVPVTSIGN